MQGSLDATSARWRPNREACFSVAEPTPQTRRGGRAAFCSVPSFSDRISGCSVEAVASRRWGAPPGCRQQQLQTVAGVEPHRAAEGGGGPERGGPLPPDLRRPRQVRHPWDPSSLISQPSSTQAPREHQRPCAAASRRPGTAATAFPERHGSGSSRRRMSRRNSGVIADARHPAALESSHGVTLGQKQPT